jgi:hypothetical protein
MRVDGGTGQISEAAALEAARRAEEARQRAEEQRRQAAEAAKKAAAEQARQAQQPQPSSDADQTSKPAAVRGTSALKLVETAVKKADPKELAATAVDDPAAAVEVATEHPGKFTDTLIKGAGLVVGGVVGNEAFQLVKSSLSARNKVNQIKDLTQKIVEAKQEASDSVTAAGATAEGLKKAAVDATKAPEAAKLDKFGKINSGLSIVTGVNSALHLRHSVAALKDGASATELANVAGDALGTLRGADEAVKLVKGSTVGFLGAKVNPAISIGADAADAVKRVSELKDNWSKMSAKDKIANFASLGGDVTDAVGSGLIMSGVGAPIGVALKAVGAGLSLVSLGVQNFDAIKHGAGKAADAVEHVAEGAAHAVQDVGHSVKEGAKKVLSSLNPF